MGREAQEPKKLRIYDAIITATVVCVELLRGRYHGRNGVLDMAA
jgi:hypothetical protein